MKQTGEQSEETTTVSQDAVDRLRHLTATGVGADLTESRNIIRRQRPTPFKQSHRLSPVKLACSFLIAVCFGAALIWPVTSSVSRTQLKMLVGFNSATIFLGSESERTRERAFVSANPSNVNVQFGGALRGALPGTSLIGTLSSPERAEQLRTVALRFPGHPEILAAVLRAESQTEVIVHRQDASEFIENKPRPKVGSGAAIRKTIKVSDTAPVNRFIDQCLEGERVDPKNAYFPLLRAMAYTELRQDNKAFEALRTASTKSVWREYIPEEFVANRSVNRAMYGNGGLIPEMALSAAILFPHYANLRELSRVVVAEAIRREVKGDIKGGLTLRQDMMKVSTSMRNQATTLIGSLVGNAMIEISMSRPGGMLRIKAPKSDGEVTTEISNSVRAKNRARFARYARQNGFADLANAVPEIVTTGERIRMVTQRGVDRGIYGLQTITRLALGQGVALILLSNVAWMLIIGAIATGVARTPRFVSGNRLTPGPFMVVISGIALTMIMSGAFTGMSVGYTVSMVSGMTGEAGSFVPMAAIAAGLVLAIPTLILIVLSIAAAINKRASFTRTITNGFAVASLPIATILMIAWAGLVYYSAGLDINGSAELMEMLQHEGKYLFRLLGEKWPV